MNLFDLFEQEPRKPVEYESTRQYGTVNFANFIKAYEKNQPTQLDFPGKQSYKLSKQYVDMLGDYYNTLETNTDKGELAYGVFTDYKRTIKLLNDLAQSKLFEKKESNDTKFSSTRLDRLRTQARARHPAADSDSEALIADFVDQQEQDQAQLDRVKNANRRQDDLLKQISAINQQQDNEIDALGTDNLDLQNNLQQIRAVNTELTKKLAGMTARRPAIKATVALPAKASASTLTPGTYVPPDASSPVNLGIPMTQTAALPQPGIATATVGGQPATVLAKPRKRRTKAEIDRERASQGAIKAIINPPRPSNVIDLFPNSKSSVDAQADVSTAGNNNIGNFPTKLARTGTSLESITEADKIPASSVMQGYSVVYDAPTGRITVSRRGQIVGTAINKYGTAKQYMTLINRIIDRAEDDKYPTDIDARDVALPMKKATQPMRAKELQESGPETWTVYFTDGTTGRITVPSDETDPTSVRKFYARKGKTVDRFDYTAAEPNTRSRPEPYEPGSGSAVSARTGDPLPEGDIVNINRGGFNAFRDKTDWLDKRDNIQRDLLDPRQRDNLPELKQRLLDINAAGRKLGYTQ